MTARQGHFDSPRSAGRWLAGFVLLCLSIVSVVPAGYMPSNVSGRMALTICSGSGEKTIYVDAADHAPDQPSPDDTSHRSPQHCLFSTLHFSQPEPAAVLIIPIAVVIVSALRDAMPERVISRPLVFPPQRGPPSLSW